MKCKEVIVVEDDRDIRESVQTVLEMEGYCVRCFCNGKEALDGLRGDLEPSLILLDLMMPVMDGWSFLQAKGKLKTCPFTSSPVVVVSAVADRAREFQGVSEFIRKPLDIDLLLRTVEKHCSPSSGGTPDRVRSIA
ncbi:MAG: response regulator [Methylotenera sp.]|nr:response regulator [Oligoflexia bacterium]